MLLDACCAGTSRPEVATPADGTINTETTMAAGALMMDAIRMWPSASGMTGARKLA